MGKYTDEYLKMMALYANPIRIGNTIGRVVEGFPDIKISILNGEVLLYKDMLYFSDHLIEGYEKTQRQSGKIRFADMECGKTEEAYADVPESRYRHSHSIKEIDVASNYDAEGTIVFTDSLKKGDQVLICQMEEEGKFCVVTKIKRVM